MKEIWKPIPDTKYEASNLGRIKRKKVLKLQIRQGYLSCTIHGKTRSVHQLVLEAFVGKKSNPMMVCRHLNGERLDNRVENLRWGTRSENSYDRYNHERIRRGKTEIIRSERNYKVNFKIDF